MMNEVMAMNEIIIKEFLGEGMQRVYENDKWTVGIKNYKPMNDIKNLDCLERHNQTDELFVLLEGSCTLVTAEEENGMLAFKAVNMDKNKVYTIPKSLWHNTVTKPDTKMILIEDSNTTMANSDIYTMSSTELQTCKDVCRGAV